MFVSCFDTLGDLKKKERGKGKKKTITPCVPVFGLNAS
jgi:hypothetical protein